MKTCASGAGREKNVEISEGGKGENRASLGVHERGFLMMTMDRDFIEKQTQRRMANI